jgi:hypothetical protein
MKSLKLINVVPVVSKLVNFIGGGGGINAYVKIYWMIWKVTPGMFSTLWKVVGWVVAECLNAFMTWNQKLDHEWMYDFGFCVEFTQHMNKRSTRLQRANYFVSGMFDEITAFESKLGLRELHLGSNNFQFWEHKSPLTLRNTLKKFSFSNKTSTSLFEIYASLRPKSTYFQCYLALMLKWFQSNSKRGWQIYSVTRSEEYTSTLPIPRSL